MAHLIPDRGVAQSTRTDLTGDHLAGIEAHPELQVDTVAVFDLSGQPSGLLVDAQRRKTSADCVVLQSRR